MQLPKTKKMNKFTNKATLIIFLAVFSCIGVFAQNTPKQLSGTVIYYDQRNRTDNTPQEAFDDNLNTYFQSDGTFGNWLGLDLGTPHIITGVEFYSRQDNKPEEYAARLEIGIFEGANSPDFGDAVALGIIPTAPGTGSNILYFTSSKGFRYVRFVFPSNDKPGGNGLSKYMAELKFYGYAGAGNNSKLPTVTNLPTVNIHTVNAEDITIKEKYLKGIVSIVYADGTKFFTDSLEIRGRGNNSWSYPKKPYRMKLFNSVKLMDLPAKGKNWTLINNYGDKTQMRNMVAFDFARRVEMPYTSPSEAVDVVLNGDYRGTYQLSDHIDVRKNRIDIEEMGPDDITGGYAIEIDAYAYPNEPKKFTSSTYNIPVTIKYPDEDDITLAQENYIAAHFSKLTSAVSSANFKHPENGFRKYLEMESFLRHFLTGEFSGNTDTYWSVRMAKRKDDDKFFVSPVWDVDLGFDNDHRTYPIMEQTRNRNNEWMALWNGGTSAAGNTKGMLQRIFSDPAVTEQLKTIYAHYRDKNVISGTIMQHVVDSLEAKLLQAQALNFKRWPIMLTKVHENPVIHGSFEAEVANVRNYIAERMDWLDSKLNYVPTSVIEQYPDLDVTIRVMQHALQIDKLPANSHVKVINVLGAVCFDKQNAESVYLNLSSGIYLINIQSNGKEFNYKCLVR